MMILRKWIATWCVLVLVGVFPACGTPEPTSEGAPKPRVALVMKSLANEFFTTMARGAEAHQEAQADSYDLIVNGIKDERDLSQQVSLVEQMIAQQVDAIVLAPADSKALVPVCKRALNAGIVVINIDNKLDDAVLTATGVQIPFVGPDNRAGARAVGAFLAEKLESGDSVAIIEGIPTAFNAQQRKLGFEEAMNAGGMRVVDSQSAHWEMSQANTVAAAMLSEHAGLRALLCCNDSMALGAVAAVKAAGKTGQVSVIGFDNISAVQTLIGSGEMVATADQHGDQLAVYGIEYALELLAGGVEPSDKQTPVDLITAEPQSKE
jgi:ribose transport system substrate-binding protein